MASGKRSAAGERVTARLSLPRDAPPSPSPARHIAPLVVDEAMDVSEDLYVELDPTVAELDSSGPLDTNILLAAFDDTTEIQSD